MTECDVFAYKIFFLILLLFIYLFLCLRVCLISPHYSFIYPTLPYSILCANVLCTEDDIRE